MDEAKAFIERLRVEQYANYTYDEFVKVLKRRVWRWTGDHSIMFSSEEELVKRLKELGVK